MRITREGYLPRWATGGPASGTIISDPGGYLGGGPISVEDAFALLLGSGVGPWLTNTLGGKDIIEDLGTLGATATCDMANASVFLGVLAEDVDISFTGWTTGRRCTIGVSLTEDGTGTWTPTFLGVTWIGGTPTWDTTAGTVTHVLLFSDDGGTNIYGAVVGSGSGGSGNFPGTVVPLGAMGATPTLDYSAGTAYTGTIDTNATVGFTGFDNLKDEGITFLVSEDGTGGHTLAFTGVTWLGGVTPTHDDTPSTSEVYAFFSFDGGTTIIGGQLGAQGTATDLDAILAASAGQDIADALLGATAPDAGNVFATMADVGGGGSSAFAILQDQKTQNTAGGTFTSGAWRTRVLNTEVSDAGNIVTLASNQFTPIAGTYRLSARAPAYLVARHKTRLQNVTAATTTQQGSTAYASAGHDVQTDSFVDAIFTANGTDAYEIQHQCGSTESTDGFGVPSNFAVEVYTSVVLEKIA